MDQEFRERRDTFLHDDQSFTNPEQGFQGAGPGSGIGTATPVKGFLFWCEYKFLNKLEDEYENQNILYTIDVVVGRM